MPLSKNGGSFIVKVIVLGGAGNMGGHAVRELAQCSEVTEVMVAGRHLTKAQAFVQGLQNPKVEAIQVDANDHEALVKALRGFNVAVGAIGPSYQYETRMARAALEAEVHYVSLCDDRDAAVQVFALDEEARRKGITLLTGLGGTPGITNVLARRAADRLQKVDEIHIAWCGSVADAAGFAVILQTMRIFSGSVPIFENGQHLLVPAGSGKEKVRFPLPVGDSFVYYVSHPEPITLPRFLPEVRQVTLKGGISERFLTSLAIFLGKMELTHSASGLLVLGRILKLLLPVLGRIGRPEAPCCAVRVDVIGQRGNEQRRIAYGVADRLGHLTGASLTAGALMLGRGDIQTRGVVAPEACISPDGFLMELHRRGIQIWEGHDMVKLLTIKAKRVSKEGF